MICVHIPKVDIFKFQGWKKVSNNGGALLYHKKMGGFTYFLLKTMGAQTPLVLPPLNFNIKCHAPKILTIKTGHL